jgi:hypothetical protein
MKMWGTIVRENGIKAEGLKARVSKIAEACTYDTGSLGGRPLAVSSNERVRGLWVSDPEQDYWRAFTI